MNEYIELNRTFYQLSASHSHAAKSDDIDVSEALGLRVGDVLDWKELLKLPRVILLAEAGAGKTREIRQATQKLRLEGKQAFFLRLEHIGADFEAAFEEGTFQDFQNWIASSEEGWILLDSVDEARLKDPKDFELAIKKLSQKISLAFLRVHIVITSRVTAWRPKTDLANCNKYFPSVIEDERKDSSEEEEFSMDETPSQQNKKTSSKKDPIGFKIYSLTNLSGEQISSFARERGIKERSKFLAEIERQDAWAFTTRPQDLEEIIEFWNDQGRIGSRFELMQHSIDRRLKERDQDRADIKSLSSEKVREGARVLAAACTLTHKSTIKVPDGSHSVEGLDVRSILSDWDDKECQTLLNFPIFDGAIYGSVRFHHRSVREYLTAEWFFGLLKNDGSRQRIESLFFRDQYGMKVALPSMKPVLSWLVLFDSNIMNKVYLLEPEIILEGGDPNKLPLEQRREILRSVCEKISLGTASRSVDDRASVQRFASADMADDIKQLIVQYHDKNEVLSYLLRLVWQGRIKAALPEVKMYAQDFHAEKYTRIVAIRSLKEIGTQIDFDDVLKSFLSEKDEKHDRRILGELIDNLGNNEKSADWILLALENVEDKERYEVDGVSSALVNFIERAGLNVIFRLIQGLDSFLKQEPLIERRFCEISEKYAWLLPVSLKAIEKIIENKHERSFSTGCLFALTQAPAFNEYGGYEDRSIKHDLPKLISDWKELNHSLFWEDVKETRRLWDKQRKDSLEYFWQVSVFRHYWSFNENDFDDIIKDISEKLLLEDRLIALSLAFQLYKDNKRPKSWLKKIKKSVGDDESLKKRLELFLHPPAQSEEIKKFHRRQAQWKRQDKEREKKRQEEHRKSLEWLSENYNKLRDNELKKGVVSHPQHYMHEKMRQLCGEDITTKWTTGNWRSLIKDYGVETAEAFRDGLLNFWRNYTPALRSESDQGNSTAFAIIFGLSGLTIEATETSNWPANLQEKDAEIACRYALHEMNGFPDWFSRLYEQFSAIINDLILNEIDWELNAEEKRHYILSKISWNCGWAWDRLAPVLFTKLKKDPLNSENLERVLKIIQENTTVSDGELSELAANKCKTLNSLDNLSHWFSVWIGIDPDTAIPNFSNHLEELNKQDPFSAKQFAMRVIVNLIGERRTCSNARGNYKTPEHLKNLYLLMHLYVKVEEDIERSGKGAYSPDLRDHAQEARSKLFSVLTEIPGKEAYLAMRTLSETHPVEAHRVWMMHSAKKRAEADADILPWSNDKFSEFNKALESTPANPRELFDSAVQRLLDLKHDLEDGDTSNAPILVGVTEEKKIRNYIGGWCRDRAKGRYSIPQEEEFADDKRSDIRFLGSGFDCAIPIELKLADNNWSGKKLHERLENQLCGDYMRDNRSSYGIFLLVYRGDKTAWELPNGNSKATFPELVDALQEHWKKISANYPKIEQITVIGIDLTKRSGASKLMAIA